ncbi:hypothetical protein [Kosmotoga sp.]|uniref:hypothetical protein n=1 Tax=Kosmotoga sp. TaxID=1955248 RepID=UPI0025873320|nr:hypothetical protein [Kosmotoga sp.]
MFLTFLVVFVGSCGVTFRELTPSNYVGFSMEGYMELTTEVVLDGTLDGFSLTDSVFLHKRLAKGTNVVEIYVIHFEKVSDATSFWYSWGRENFSTLRTALSAIPLVYGELKGEVFNEYIYAWFNGKWVYIFRGTENSVKETARKFKSFMKELKRSIES